MVDPRGGPTSRDTIKLAALAWVHPVFALFVGGRRLLKNGGWKKMLLLVSVMGNIVFLTGIILAELDFGDGNSKPDVSYPQDCAMPNGLACRSQGPLFFGEFSPDSDAAKVLPPTVFVVQDGCILAAFEYDADHSSLGQAQLYDRACRPKVELDLSMGATVYSFYDDASDPVYSLRDEDGDGIPDWRIDWDEGQSLSRSGEVIWIPSKTD